jgi:hypothetical protein
MEPVLYLVITPLVIAAKAAGNNPGASKKEEL